MAWKIFDLNLYSGGLEDFSKGQQKLIEVKNKQEMGSNLKINGRIYNVCRLDLINQHIGVREIKFVDPEEVDETLESEFTCPYCGYVDRDSFELQESDEINCPRCDSEVSYEREVTVEYRVVPIKRARIKKIL